MAYIPPSTKTIATTYNVAVTDYTLLCNAAGAGFTVTLPLAASCVGIAPFYIKKEDATGNVVTVVGNGGELIDGTNSVTLDTPQESVRIQSNGTKWIILASN